MRKKLSLSIVLMLLSLIITAQMEVPPSGGNPRARIIEEVGITDISIKYSRPDVGGRDGKIWGDLVSYGFNSDNFITGKRNLAGGGQ